VYRVAFETLGCRLNQAETAIMQDRFVAKGYTLADDPAEADLFVLHTCTLTTQATARCRRVLRRVSSLNPNACIAAVGCYAQTDAGELARIDGVDYVIGTADKMHLADIIATPVKMSRPVVMTSRASASAFTIEGHAHDPLHTRANLKIQEGCDFVCAFCIIPRSRGRARSRDFGDLVRDARALAALGHREIVLTGVNIGTYRESGRTLFDVIRAIEDIDGIDRIRISSIEPTTIEDGVVDLMAMRGKLCPYLHVPLQSGDDAVLCAMRRRYSAGAFHRFMQRAMDRVPGIAFGTDIIVGFPGEDAAAFERSCDMVHALPFVNVHVFGFSPRPRTRAYAMASQVASHEIHRRHERLSAVARESCRGVYQSMVGREVRVLFERPAPDGTVSGFSDEYVRVRVDTPVALTNQLCPVRVTGVDAAGSGARLFACGEIQSCATDPLGRAGTTLSPVERREVCECSESR